MGANTVIGAQVVAKAQPDGYTLLMAIDSTLVMNQYLYKSLPYDPINDFAPITLVAKTLGLLVVNAASDMKTVKDLIAKAKAAARQAQLRRRHDHDQADGLSFSTRSPASTPCSCPITAARRSRTAF